MDAGTAPPPPKADLRAAAAIRRPRAPLRVLGTSVTQLAPICRAAEEDLGYGFEFITLDGA